ncbi:MAG: VanZ family protein [Candidatus Kryptoniota bacterium]
MSLKKYPDFVRFHLPAFIWMAFIFTLSSIPGSSLAPIEFPYAHPIAHTLLYAMLYYLFFRALGHQRFSTFLYEYRTWIAFLFAAAYGASDEFHQSFTPGRTEEFKDFLIDVMAALVVLIAIVLINKSRREGESLRSL